MSRRKPAPRPAPPAPVDTTNATRVIVDGAHPSTAIEVPAAEPNPDYTPGPDSITHELGGEIADLVDDADLADLSDEAQAQLIAETEAALEKAKAELAAVEAELAANPRPPVRTTVRIGDLPSTSMPLIVNGVTRATLRKGACLELLPDALEALRNSSVPFTEEVADVG